MRRPGGRPHVEGEGADQDMFIRHNMAAVLRGSTQQRYEAYAVAIDKGFMTINEVRALEDLPPLDEPPPPAEGSTA